VVDRTLRHLLDSIAYQYKYLRIHKAFCSFGRPRRFSEKIFHRMRYPKEVYSIIADKVAVREYIQQIVGAEYLVPVYLISDDVSKPVLQSLPNTFVMKANHSAGQVRIVRDKSVE